MAYKVLYPVSLVKVEKAIKNKDFEVLLEAYMTQEAENRRLKDHIIVLEGEIGGRATVGAHSNFGGGC